MVEFGVGLLPDGDGAGQQGPALGRELHAAAAPVLRIDHDLDEAKVMADPRVQADANPMPFDGKRVIYGGFEVLVEA
jgi:hypothetical protein